MHTSNPIPNSVGVKQRVSKALFAMAILGSSPVFAQDGLVEHAVVDESRLSEGARVQVNSKVGSMTRDQCAALIDKYRAKALPKGQVSVHKPSTLKAMNGAILPFCIENFDGEGIVFNTDFHPDAK